MVDRHVAAATNTPVGGMRMVTGCTDEGAGVGAGVEPGFSSGGGRTACLHLMEWFWTGLKNALATAYIARAATVPER